MFGLEDEQREEIERLRKQLKINAMPAKFDEEAEGKFVEDFNRFVSMPIGHGATSGNVKLNAGGVALVDIDFETRADYYKRKYVLKVEIIPIGLGGSSTYELKNEDMVDLRVNLCRVLKQVL